MNLKASDQVQFFKGAQLCTMGTACLIWKIQSGSRSLSRWTTHARAEIKISRAFELYPARHVTRSRKHDHITRILK